MTARTWHGPITFMAGSLARTSFRQQVTATASAGFQAITCWPNIWRHATRKDGLDLRGMRQLLDDAGLRLTDVDACQDWAVAPVIDSPLPAPAPRTEFFEVCNALGGTTIVAAHPPGSGTVSEADIEGFASLCDDADTEGLRVALEYVPFTGVPDLPTALRVLRDVGRPNAGLVIDLWHHARSGGQPADLETLDPSLVFTVQLADGPARPPESLLDEAVFHRQLPGHGDFPLAAGLRVLAELGVQAPMGPEVFRTDAEQRPTADVAQELYFATAELLGRL